MGSVKGEGEGQSTLGDQPEAGGGPRKGAGKVPRALGRDDVTGEGGAQLSPGGTNGTRRRADMETLHWWPPHRRAPPQPQTALPPAREKSACAAP